MGGCWWVGGAACPTERPERCVLHHDTPSINATEVCLAASGAVLGATGLDIDGSTWGELRGALWLIAPSGEDGLDLVLGAPTRAPPR